MSVGHELFEHHAVAPCARSGYGGRDVKLTVFRLPTTPKDTSSVQEILIDADEVSAATEDGGRERGLHRCGGSLDGRFRF